MNLCCDNKETACAKCRSSLHNPEKTKYLEEYQIKSLSNNLNIIEDQTKYGYYFSEEGVKRWVFTEKDCIKAINYDIFRRIVNSPAFVATYGYTGDKRFFCEFSIYYHECNIYLLNIFSIQFGCIFYTEIFKEGILLKPIDILKWLIEIIFPIKYLHDNNIYYHNLSAENLLLDKNKNLCLAPSNFPFHLYFTPEKYLNLEAEIKRDREWFSYDFLHDEMHKFTKTKEFPKLSEEMIKIEIKGIFEFWYELCTHRTFVLENNNSFNLIEKYYGPRWRTLIENSLPRN